MNDLFPEIVSKAPAKPPALCQVPYFLVGYWPRDTRWRVFTENYVDSDGAGILKEIARLTAHGWTNIHVMRLPDSLWK